VQGEHVAAIIVAAGRSTRMGRQKALIEIEGEMILARLAHVLGEADLDPLIVVASGETMDAALMELSGVVLIEGDPDAPMIDSIARGIDRVGPLPKGAVIQPVDAPFTTKAMIDTLLSGDLGTPRLLASEGTAGHPVFLPRALFDAVRARPEGGLRAVLDANRATFVPWADKRVLADIDTPEDLARWLA
jgi:molybdenum cofactor cytidylyltransferase